jgi:hypothetical protein
MPSIAEVAGQIASADVPVLFLDTCILLDIIRSPNRCLKNCVMKASELLKLASLTPPACIIVISSIVPREWNTHVQKVTDEIVKHCKTMEEHATHFHDACEALGIAVEFGRADYAQWGLPEKLRDLSEQLLNRAIRLDEDLEGMNRSAKRFRDKRPPARKGGDDNDCAVIEEYLAVCQKLQSAALMRKRVFCTSNTNDYCDAGDRTKPHPQLTSEFNACGLTFTANLPWAVDKITG